jgi:predicted kinase
LTATRSADRLDHRLAARRLRAKHVRAVGRALASERRGDGQLSSRAVWVGKKRRVRFSGRAGGSADAAALARELHERGAARRGEQLACAYAFAADDYAVLASIAPPASSERVLVAIGGLVATGKSTVAKHVARRLGAPRVVADRVREALLDHARGDAVHELAWAPELAELVYGGLLARADAALASGRSVVLDACFASAARRRAAEALARSHGARFVFGVCRAPREQIDERLRLRDERDGGPPGGWRTIARAVARGWEPPRRGAFVSLDTTRAGKTWTRALGLRA